MKIEIIKNKIPQYKKISVKMLELKKIYKLRIIIIIIISVSRQQRACTKKKQCQLVVEYYTLQKKKKIANLSFFVRSIETILL